MTLVRYRKLLPAFALVGLAACGSDSTGPASLTPDDALRSLSLGFGSANGVGLPFALGPSALGTAARGIDQIDVNINGTMHRMYALGLRVTYPSGTCIETLFIVPSFPPPEDVCTPPPLGLVLALWQTTSGQRPPKRMAFISADVGTVNFSFLAPENETLFTIPSFAIYINDREEFWTSLSGSLTSAVTVGSETCNVPAPPFASSSTCNFATFDEQGQITLERFDFSLFEPSSTIRRATMDFVIPRQSIRGIVQAITQITPVTIPGGWDY